MYKIGLIILTIFSLVGCSTMGTKLTDEHAQAHNVTIQVDEKSKKFLKYVDVSHRLYEDNVYLTLSGSVRKPFGTFASSVTANVKFMDDKGQVIAQEKDKALLHRSGGRTHRRYEGSFFIQIPDNPDIVKCGLAFL